MVNKVAVRVQRPRSGEGCDLEVFRVVGDRHEPVFDDEVEDWEDGRRRAGRLVAGIRAGTFVAQDVDGWSPGVPPVFRPLSGTAGRARAHLPDKSGTVVILSSGPRRR